MNGCRWPAPAPWANTTAALAGGSDEKKDGAKMFQLYLRSSA
jgi:hypothetical protein